MSAQDWSRPKGCQHTGGKASEKAEHYRGRRFHFGACSPFWITRIDLGRSVLPDEKDIVGFPVFLGAHAR